MEKPHMASSLPDHFVSKTLQSADETISRDAARKFHAA